MQRALRGYAEAQGYPVVWTASLGAPVPLLYVVVSRDARRAMRGQAFGASEPSHGTGLRCLRTDRERDDQACAGDRGPSTKPSPRAARPMPSRVTCQGPSLVLAAAAIGAPIARALAAAVARRLLEPALSPLLRFWPLTLSPSAPPCVRWAA